MDIFGNKETLKKLLNLEKDIQRLSKADLTIAGQIADLRISVSESLKRSPDYEKEAKSASKRASEYKNKASDTLSAISTLLDDVKSNRSEAAAIKEEIKSIRENINEELEGFQSQADDIANAKQNIYDSISSTEEKIEQISKIFEDYPDLSESLSELENFTTQVEENHEKSTQLLKAISSRRTEILNIHREIFGFDQEDAETDEITHVPGLKEELEHVYTKLEKRSGELSKSLSTLEKTTNDEYKNLIEISKKKNLDLEEEWNAKHSEINKKIQSLLPNALTAGLSHAFSKKKEDEDDAYEKHKTQFGYGILGLVIVSIIPFAISIVFLLQDKSLEQVIYNIPRVVLAIVPLYLPVLWLAFSSSKKMNLSKRLIEEYSHKEVLSKTFEGLSSQINSLDDNEISSELRIKLLQNFMQVYSENPGKLISNYETSDHPIMEILEQSHKLDATVEKLRKFPGLDKISKILESKSEKLIRESEVIVEEGLETMKKLEEKE